IVESRQYAAGSHEHIWNAAGKTSGVYFYKLQTDSYTKTKRMLLLK
ncbi:MAG: T9SS C-terminal target domain-containing protein, partial [Candidatus Cloacimonadota bacterium]